MRVTAGLTHAAAFLGGIVVASAILAHAVPRSQAARRDRYDTLDTFAQSLSYILTEYVDQVDERTLLYGAVDSTVYSLEYAERSATAWRPYISPIKIIMVIGIFLMLLQAFAIFFKDLAKARGEEL